MSLSKALLTQILLHLLADIRWYVGTEMYSILILKNNLRILKTISLMKTKFLKERKKENQPHYLCATRYEINEVVF